MGRLDQGQSLTESSPFSCRGGTFCPRVALFVLKGGSCIGWSGEGFDQTPGFNNDALKRISVPSSADTVFRAVIDSRQSYLGESTAHRDNVQLLTRIGNVFLRRSSLRPFFFRDRVAAVLYADSGDSRESLRVRKPSRSSALYVANCWISGAEQRPPGPRGRFRPTAPDKLKESTPRRWLTSAVSYPPGRAGPNRTGADPCRSGFRRFGHGHAQCHRPHMQS